MLTQRMHLIAEIEEHMMNRRHQEVERRREEEELRDEWMENDLNMMYDYAEGHPAHLKGSMNEADPNLMYDLAEGHNLQMSGSMNEVTEEQNIEQLFLSLYQKMEHPEAAYA